MDLESNARKELLDSLLNIMVTPNLKESSHSETDDSKYTAFIKAAKLGHNASVQLALDYVLKDELFNLRFQQATGDLENPARIKAVKKEIARIKTVLTERENADKE